jgi:NAD+ synthase
MRKGFVVGISGGIDSALTSTLCAMTNKPVVVVTMPIHNKNMDLAKKHVQWLTHDQQHLNIIHCHIDLIKPFEAFKQALPPIFQEDGLALANAASRLRMMTLYSVASTGGMLVVGTGNRIEDFGVGFFTKYGDGGVDISPIGDLKKSQVYEVAKALGIIPEIINAKPSDGLWVDARSDEDQVGASDQ